MWGNRTQTRWGGAFAARGGVSAGAILTGVVVAFGAMFLLSALVGGILFAADVDARDLGDSTVEAGIGAGAVIVVAQFLSYLWGGYTAGRMGRGAGALNGLLVPLVALVIAVIVGAIATALGAAANLNLPFTTNRLPLDEDLLVDYGAGIGIGILIAMFAGGLVGGLAGARWHTKLERRAGDETAAPAADTRDRRTVDLGNDDTRTGTDTTADDSTTRTSRTERTNP